jgi:acyl-CoA oxidase
MRSVLDAIPEPRRIASRNAGPGYQHAMTAVAPRPVVAELRAFLDGPHGPVRDRVREWLSAPGNQPRDDLPLEEHRAQVLAWARELADSGETVLGYPEEFGGRGDLGGYISGFETLAFGDLSLLVKAGVQWGLFGGAVQHLGTRRHHEAHLADIASLDLPGCFAMTEEGHGSNVQDIRTTATYDDDTGEFVVHTPIESAHKAWIGNAARDGRMAAVFAQLVVGGAERGVHALLVPLRDDDGNVLPGIRIEDCGPKLGLDGVDNGRIWFDRVRVPRDNLLDRYATVSADGVYHSDIESATKRFFKMLGTLIQGRISVCGAAINASKVALATAVRHATTRRQFGPPGGDEVVLMTYRTHQRRLLPHLADAYALHFAQEGLVAALAERFGGDDDAKLRELETMAAGLKAIGTWHATATIQDCREACGGAGYLRANRFAALKADTDVFTTFEGDNTVLLQLVAKNLLTDFKAEFGELDALGTAAFFAGQVFETIAERSALRELFGRLGDDLRPGRDEEGTLLDREIQLATMRWREDHVKQSLARRLRRGLEGDGDPFELLIDCQDHLVLAARAYVDRLVLEAFAAAVERAPEGEPRELLSRLCDLHALHRFERERGWFQEHGRFSSTRSKAIVKAVNVACADLAPHARTLVDAFGVPEAVLGESVREPDV